MPEVASPPHSVVYRAAVVGAGLSFAASITAAVLGGGFALIAGIFGLVPYAGVIVLSRDNASTRRWGLLALALYTLLDLVLRVESIRRPVDLNTWFMGMAFVVIVPPVVAACAGVGVLLWRVVGKAGLVLWALGALVGSVAAYQEVFGTVPSFTHELNVPHLPESVSGVICADAGFQETDLYCYFEISPSEFPELISGRAFVEVPDSGRAHAHGPKLGPNFDVAAKYSVTWTTPEPGFKQNHSTTLYTDSARHRVFLNHAGW